MQFPRKSSKKQAKKKAAAPKPVARPSESGTVYYRKDSILFRVVSKEILIADGGGWDLAEVPKGEVSEWDGAAWFASVLPESARHTKNVAKIGV